MRLRQALAGLAFRLDRRRADGAGGCVRLRRERELDAIASDEADRRRSVGGERDVERGGGDLAALFSRVARDHQRRAAADRGVLERFAVCGVLQVHLLPRERLQRAGRRLCRRDPRLIVKLDRVDALLVFGQEGDRRFRFDDLIAALDAHAAFEADEPRAACERRAARSDFGGARARGVRRDVDDRLIENREDVGALLPRHAEAGALHAAARELHRPRRAHGAVGVGVRGVLGRRRHPVGALKADIAVEHDRRIVAAHAAFLPADRERAAAVALVGDDLDALKPARAVGVEQLLLESDADVLTRSVEFAECAAGGFGDRAGVGLGRHAGRRQRVARLQLPRDEGGEQDAEHGDHQARVTLKARHGRGRRTRIAG